MLFERGQRLCEQLMRRRDYLVQLFQRRADVGSGRNRALMRVRLDSRVDAARRFSLAARLNFAPRALRETRAEGLENLRESLAPRVARAHDAEGYALGRGRLDARLSRDRLADGIEPFTHAPELLVEVREVEVGADYVSARALAHGLAESAALVRRKLPRDIRGEQSGHVLFVGGRVGV